MARKRAKPAITQNELAVRLQVMGFKIEQAAVSKLEMGRRPVNDYELIALARALGVTVGWLLGEGEPSGGIDRRR